MAIDGKLHRQNGTTARVSQASREDARPALLSRFDSYQQEYEFLRNELRRINQELSVGFGESAFTKAQMKVRQQNKDSLKEWMKLRTEMQDAKQKLVSQKLDIEARIPKVKTLAREERDRNQLKGIEKRRIDYGECALAIIDELKGLRSAIEGLASLIKKGDV